MKNIKDTARAFILIGLPITALLSVAGWSSDKDRRDETKANKDGEHLKIVQMAPMNETRMLLGTANGKDGKIYAFGGAYDPQANSVAFRSTVECYDVKSKKWSYRHVMPGPKAWHRAATALDGKIYLFGGSTNSTPSKDVWAYDPLTDSWDTSLPQMLQEERDTVAVTARDGIIYLFGGYWNYNTVQAFNPSTRTWEIKSPMPTGRWAADGALGPDGKIYIVGGGAPGEPDSVVYNTLEVYDPATDIWETKSPMPTARNYLGAAFGRDGLLYAIGGEVYGAGRTGITYDVIESYDPHSNSWKTAGHLGVKLTSLSGATVSDAFCNIHTLGGGILAGPMWISSQNLHNFIRVKGHKKYCPEHKQP